MYWIIDRIVSLTRCKSIYLLTKLSVLAYIIITSGFVRTTSTLGNLIEPRPKLSNTQQSSKHKLRLI